MNCPQRFFDNVQVQSFGCLGKCRSTIDVVYYIEKIPLKFGKIGTFSNLSNHTLCC